LNTIQLPSLRRAISEYPLSANVELARHAGPQKDKRLEAVYADEN
jgi:hypothetical protein